MTAQHQPANDRARIRAFRVTCAWFEHSDSLDAREGNIVYAESAGRARYRAALSLDDAYDCGIGKALQVLRVRRAPSYDRMAARYGEGAVRSKWLVDAELAHV